MKKIVLLAISLCLALNTFAETKPNPVPQKGKTTTVNAETRRVVDYYIVVGRYDDFMSELKKMLDEGWQPWGDCSCQLRSEMMGTPVYFYMQAMVKYE